MNENEERRKLFTITEDDAFNISETATKLKEIADIGKQMVNVGIADQKEIDFISNLNELSDFILDKFPIEKRNE